MGMPFTSTAHRMHPWESSCSTCSSQRSTLVWTSLQAGSHSDTIRESLVFEDLPYLKSYGNLDGMAVPNIHCTLAFICALSRPSWLVYQELLDRSILPEEPFALKELLVCKLDWDPDHIEQVLLDNPESLQVVYPLLVDSFSLLHHCTLPLC